MHNSDRRLVSVRGPISSSELGRSLVHEHIMVDWVGADLTGPHRYDKDIVVATMAPYLRDIASMGYKSFFDCSPAYLGRDGDVLLELSELTGLNIITNTGLYKEPYIPSWALEASVSELSDSWILEATRGIANSGIRPGFIKIAVHPGPLAPMQERILLAAARTSCETGLTIAGHTSDDMSALAQLELLQSVSFNLDKFIVVHADMLSKETLLRLTDAGAWIEFDSVGAKPIEYHVQLVAWAVSFGLEDRVLLSHDAGWFTVGEPGGGTVKPYTAINAELLPALKTSNIWNEKLEREFLVRNPVEAFSLA